MKSGRQFVYRYDGDATTDEVEVDGLGEVQIPEKDSFITRKGSRWKVVHVTQEQDITNPRAFPIWRIFLSGKG